MALVALLDANALFSPALRDTLLRAAEYDLYRPAWSQRILEEMKRSILLKRPDVDPARLDRTISLLLAWFPDALVTGYEDLIASMTNHPGDRHVLAAAVRAGADVIVTNNGRHFLPVARDTYAIDVQTPDLFLRSLWDVDADTLVRVLEEQGQALNPPRASRDVVQALRRSSARGFAELVLNSGRV